MKIKNVSHIVAGRERIAAAATAAASAACSLLLLVLLTRCCWCHLLLLLSLSPSSCLRGGGRCNSLLQSSPTSCLKRRGGAAVSAPVAAPVIVTRCTSCCCYCCCRRRLRGWREGGRCSSCGSCCGSCCCRHALRSCLRYNGGELTGSTCLCILFSSPPSSLWVLPPLSSFLSSFILLSTASRSVDPRWQWVGVDGTDCGWHTKCGWHGSSRDAFWLVVTCLVVMGEWTLALFISAFQSVGVSGTWAALHLLHVPWCIIVWVLPVEKYESTVVVARATIFGCRGGAWDCSLWVVPEVLISGRWMWVWKYVAVPQPQWSVPVPYLIGL